MVLLLLSLLLSTGKYDIGQTSEVNIGSKAQGWNSFSNNLVDTRLYSSGSSVSNKYLLDGKLYRGCKCSVRLRNPVFSAINDGWSTSTMKLSNFFTPDVVPFVFLPPAKNSLRSFMWCFFKCLIALVALYVARELPPLWITACKHCIFLSCFAVFLVWNISTQWTCWLATVLLNASLLTGCKLWNGFPEQGRVS